MEMTWAFQLEYSNIVSFYFSLCIVPSYNFARVSPSQSVFSCHSPFGVVDFGPLLCHPPTCQFPLAGWLLPLQPITLYSLSSTPFCQPSLPFLYFQASHTLSNYSYPPPKFKPPPSSSPDTDSKPVNPTHSVINLSSQPLTASETLVLSKALLLPETLI